MKNLYNFVKYLNAVCLTSCVYDNIPPHERDKRCINISVESVENLKGGRSLKRPMGRLLDNIKMDSGHGMRMHHLP
jgi:hypothetical protein